MATARTALLRTPHSVHVNQQPDPGKVVAKRSARLTPPPTVVCRRILVALRPHLACSMLGHYPHVGELDYKSCHIMSEPVVNHFLSNMEHRRTIRPGKPPTLKREDQGLDHHIEARSEQRRSVTGSEASETM